VEQKELVDCEFSRTTTSFKKNSTAWQTVKTNSEPRSGKAAYAHLKSAMYTKLASNCTALHLSAPGASEKDRLAEEEEATAELMRKGRLNQKPSDSWKVRGFAVFFGTDRLKLVLGLSSRHIVLLFVAFDPYSMLSFALAPRDPMPSYPIIRIPSYRILTYRSNPILSHPILSHGYPIASLPIVRIPSYLILSHGYPIPSNSIPLTQPKALILEEYLRRTQYIYLRVTLFYPIVIHASHSLHIFAGDHPIPSYLILSIHASTPPHTYICG
jgi:hypothetical protein